MSIPFDSLLQSLNSPLSLATFVTKPQKTYYNTFCFRREHSYIVFIYLWWPSGCCEASLYKLSQWCQSITKKKRYYPYHLTLCTCHSLLKSAPLQLQTDLSEYQIRHPRWWWASSLILQMLRPIKSSIVSPPYCFYFRGTVILNRQQLQ